MASPAQMLFGTIYLTILPKKRTLLEPKIVKNIAKKIKINQSQVEKYYNKSAEKRIDLQESEMFRKNSTDINFLDNINDKNYVGSA